MMTVALGSTGTLENTPGVRDVVGATLEAWFIQGAVQRGVSVLGATPKVTQELTGSHFQV